MVHIEQSVPKGFKDLIKNTVWGTKTRYIQTNFNERLSTQIDPYFISIRRKDRLIATVNLLGRSFETRGADVEAYYIRYFSFFSSYQVAERASTKKRKSSSLIRNEINELFKKGSLKGSMARTIYYAYVEMGNQRSKDMCEKFNFEPIRRFSTLIFSRIKPGKHVGFSLIEDKEIPEVKRYLVNYYQGYTMYNSNQLDKRRYFVYKVGGNIVAGVQALPTTWIIKDLPGITGKLILKLAGKLPLLSRVFNPSDYKFLGIDQIYCVPGAESKLKLLLESVCRHYGYYSALMWADTDSHLYNSLKKIPLGPMNKLKKEVPADIIANFATTNQSDVSEFKNNPAYINATDLT